MNELIRTAILGYGRSGGNLHVNAIDRIKDFKVQAVCDVDPAARKTASTRFGCRVYSDYKKMLAEEKLDIVVIVTRSDQHCRMACDCLKAGVNCLVTKPWALDSGEADEMIAAAKKAGQALLPWLPARRGCDLLLLKEIVGRGIIGDIFQVRRSQFSFGIRNDWQTQKKYGGGYLLNWGPHLIDQPVQLVGQKIKSVYGHLNRVINPGDAEDVFYAVMKTENNVMIVSEYNVGAPGLPGWVVQGKRGTIFVKEDCVEVHQADYPSDFDPSSFRNPVKIEVVNDKIAGLSLKLQGERYGDPVAIYTHIARVLRGKESYSVTLESALNLTRLMDAVRTSHATGEVVKGLWPL